MKKGFTLIEMTIVLLIIAALIGGILVGRGMMETARIQNLMKNLQQYEAAATKFKEAYQYYPGDSPDFIPAGNGDNILSWGSAGVGKDCGSSPNELMSNYEYHQFFAHLSQAGMLDKNYIN
jgi:prepilin-type N-terminal cleavage/methylation domain-containing protein